MARLQIVQTDAEQPWHVRVLGSNGEPIATSEKYAAEESAEVAIAVLAEAFGITMSRPPEVNTDREVGELGLRGETPEGVFHIYPVERVDERDPQAEGDDDT